MPDADCIRRGRFAPSPTGPLHFGSLVTAAASYFDARTQSGSDVHTSRGVDARTRSASDVHASRGEWLVRIEDVDTPRTVPGAADEILRALEAFGLEWDGAVMYQSRRSEAYAEALAKLAHADQTFHCGCTRKEIADSLLRASSPADELVYPGTCRNGLAPGRSPRSIRVRAGQGRIEFHDRVQGIVGQDLARDIGDFVLRRADGPYAYQLAVVVDDAAQGISDVVRGADLLGSTPRQVFLQRRLGVATPRYAHIPVAVNAAGEKLSKQTLAQPVDIGRAAELLVSALAFLGQAVPAELGRAGVTEVRDWALEHWSIARVPRALSIRAD